MMRPSETPAADRLHFVEDASRVVSLNLPWDALSGQSILVTGASGMIPMHTAVVLTQANDRFDLDLSITLLVRDEARARARLGSLCEHPNVHLIAADVSQADLSGRHFETIFHGASPARPSLHATNPSGTLKANAIGTIRMLDLLADTGGSFVLMSSSEVYGAHPGGGLLSETDFGPLDPYNVRGCYFEGKRLAETSVAVYAEQFGIRPTVVRFGHVYGPGMALDDGRVQADFAADVAAGRDIVLTGDGTAVRTYTYVSDAVAGMFTAVLVGKDPVYNVADPNGAVSIRQLAQAFIASRPQAGLSVRFAQGAPAKGVSSQKVLSLDSTRLIELGWAPQVALVDGVTRMVDALSSK
ncbi:NAD-dependent epimerase/dehydratase family protein [Schaalia vaccimaxillae]|uniref:NAD-dependent epimerase/dehydratase family protein n=1 Tax=Schaalia vaccimaxillae TaxID=183916 RepID=UPI0003B6A2E1|nr:NAD-dependent epimerase/dehydratase family protein [Schaalia vaccimaxillae]